MTNSNTYFDIYEILITEKGVGSDTARYLTDDIMELMESDDLDIEDAIAEIY